MRKFQPGAGNSVWAEIYRPPCARRAEISSSGKRAEISPVFAIFPARQRISQPFFQQRIYFLHAQSKYSFRSKQSNRNILKDGATDDGKERYQ